MNKNYKYFIALFFTSLTLFFYQLFVNRLFAVILSNQYSYLVISFAILGLGIGGILVYYLSRRERFNLNFFSIAYIVTYIGTITLIFLAPYLGSPIWYIILGMIPFIFGGGITSYLFKAQPNTYRIYFTDLIGGITGLVSAMLLMNYLGTIPAIVISFIFVTVIPVVLNYNKINLTLTIIIALTLILGFGSFVSLYQNNFNSFLTTPYAHYEDDGEYKFTRWDAFARTDAVWTAENPDEMVIGLNGRSFSRMIKFNGNLDEIQYLKNQIGYLPFEIGDPEKVAIIGSGGGAEIIYSFLAGVEDITAIEINAGTIEATRELAEFSGDIYNDPRVNTVIADGRSFISNSNEKYDQIYLALVMTNIGDNVANTLSENFIYTREALGDYFSKLKPGGNVSFLFHSTTDLLKMLTTSISYFEDLGVPREDIPDHFVLLSHKNSAMNPVLLVKPEPFPQEELRNIEDFVTSKGFRPLHLPGITEEKSLNLYRTGEISISDMVHSFPANIAPISDDKPFFYNVQKSLPKSLLVLVLGTLFVLIVTFLIPIFSKSVNKNKMNFNISFLIFTFLGMAFMFIEITLIQKMSVFLEHPTTSYVTIITTLLLGAGIANLVQSRKEFFTDYKPLIYLLILGLLDIFIINEVIYWEGITSLGYKIALVCLLLLPLGFLMGIPFPMVLKKLRETKSQNWVPYFWGINGIASVLGSGLAMIISLSYGFNVSYIIGMTLYLSIALLIRRLDFLKN
ncbi:MAG: hypothetical protein FH762_17660 [Firmicutes bacterium]|nr:hypothetical protein [Bacillota bacterium]